jgi:hypothetical protein
MRGHLLRSVVAACHTPWILDIDTTVKPLFGHQEGAEVGYNPHKPGRPSHAYCNTSPSARITVKEISRVGAGAPDPRVAIRRSDGCFTLTAAAAESRI